MATTVAAVVLAAAVAADGPAVAVVLVAAAHRVGGKMTIPDWAKPYLSLQDIQDVENVVAEVETWTSGEIVPMVVRRSSTIGHIPLFIYCFLFLLYFVLGVQDYLMDHLIHSWWVVVIWAVAMVPVTWFLSRMEFVQRLLVSSRDRERQAWHRAELEFHRAGLKKTDGSTGILLFVSLVDHEAVVLGDSAISEKFDRQDWQEVLDLLVHGIRSKNMATGFRDAIRKCGDSLKEHFPIAPDDVNELPNTLIIKE